MPSPCDPTADGDDEVRLSRRLVILHVAGLVFLVSVVVSSVLWVSAEHNRLARDGSERLVAGGVAAFRAKVDTLVRDYSIWDEAYAAARSDDRGWLYSNIGNAAAEIGTLDLILFADPRDGTAFGWREGSPPEGETEVLPPDLLETVLGLIDRPGPSRAVFAMMDGEIWALSVARVRPVAGAPPGVPDAELPRQVHGLKLSQERLDSLAQSLLVDGGLAIAAEPAPGQAALELVDAAGEPLAQVVWSAPRPGARILRSLAVPLSIALALAGAIALVSARYAVRSARRLERAVVAARAADRMKSEFLSNVTHELRTPMNGIRGAAQLLDLTELDAEQRELLGILETSSRTQMSLINDLLDFARIEAGHAALTAAPFAPATTLDEIGGMIRAGLASKGVEFDTSWRDLGGLTVLGDARAFRQIVTNLLGNACKFTSHGRISAAASVVRRGGYAEIVVAVTDTGIGIAPEDLARIFDRFYRVDGSTTRSTDGAGLGLAISQRLAGMMGGRIEVESRLGVGSTFRFHLSLPIVAADDAETRDAA
jgi:signal transduction histidine kinase